MVKTVAIVSLSSGVMGEAFAGHELKIGRYLTFERQKYQGDDAHIRGERTAQEKTPGKGTDAFTSAGYDLLEILRKPRLQTAHGIAPVMARGRCSK